MTASDTAARKTAAIQAMHNEIAPTIETWTSETVAARIRELSPVIRSEKWRDAVEHYAHFVESYPDSLSWAYFQGSVYFAYAID